MPKYSYVAIDDLGRRVKGKLITPTEDTLKNSLTSMGLYLLNSRMVKEGNSLLSYERRVKRKDIIDLTINLKTLISAGVPLVQGLNDIVDQLDNKRLKGVVDDVRRNIQAGSSFSDALELHPELFGATYVNIVRAGEATGRLDTILDDLARFLEWEEELVANIKQATIYPSIVVGAVVGLIILLFTFVFPRFIVIFKATKVELPLPTKIVIWVSTFFQNNVFYVLAGAGVFYLLIRLYGRTERGRLKLDTFKLKIPVIGSLLIKIEASRFSHYLSLLLRSGVDTSQSLWIVGRVVQNRYVMEQVRGARNEITTGGSLSLSLKRSGVFPPVVTRMVSAGESTGKLDETLDKVSEYYDREVPMTVKKVFAILEPMIILLLASIVLGAALSMFLALYKMVGALSMGG